MRTRQRFAVWILVTVSFAAVTGCGLEVGPPAPDPSEDACMALEEFEKWSFEEGGRTYTMFTTEYAIGVFGATGVGLKPGGLVLVAGTELRADRVLTIITPEASAVWRRASGLNSVCEAVSANRALIVALSAEIQVIEESDAEQSLMLQDQQEDLDELREQVDVLFGDEDGDGVKNWADGCFGTPQGVAVNSNGCPVEDPDEDGDGVPDETDECPNTPPGVPVNAAGCPDSDGDGVYDNVDECPGTPQGTPVDSVGCPLPPLDSDGDGVPDSVDQCPGTPTGAPVNSVGCPDSDGDGVYDNIDQCPGTPQGIPVDPVGCPLATGPLTLLGHGNLVDHIPANTYGELCIPTEDLGARSVIAATWRSVRQRDGAEIVAPSGPTHFQDRPMCKNYALTGVAGDVWISQAWITFEDDPNVPVPTNTVTTILH